MSKLYHETNTGEKFYNLADLQEGDNFIIPNLHGGLRGVIHSIGIGSVCVSFFNHPENKKRQHIAPATQVKRYKK